jgi:hypothetical protein
MSTTGTNTSCLATEPTCLCGIEVSISTRFGLIEASFAGGHLVDEELIFTDNQSVVWVDELGVDYILNFSYNTVLGRWELSYDDIVFGVFYSDSQCPLSECDWDLDCIAIDFKALGVTRGYYSWTGEYFNGKRAYYFSSDWDGVSTIDYQIVWDLIPPSAGAPSGTYAWIFSDATEEVPIFIGFLDTDGCPYGEYVADWEGTYTRFQIANPGVSDYILQTKAADCGCCDTTLQLEIGVVEVGIVTVEASVEYDTYGNILGINGKPYYVFEIGETTYYLFFLDGEWVVKTSLGGPFLELPRAVLQSNSDCPYGFYSTDLEFYSFWVRGVECFDCCNYYAPRFSNFIKKKKYDLVDDISAIRNKEIFGMKCGPEWSDLFRKHLILNVLHCLPYGVLCEEEEQCLIKNVNENCNC